MFWRLTIAVLVICPVIRCQSHPESNNNFQSEKKKDSGIRSTANNSSEFFSENSESPDSINGFEDSHYDEGFDAEEYWNPSDSYAPESLNNIINNGSMVGIPSTNVFGRKETSHLNSKSTDQASDKLRQTSQGTKHEKSLHDKNSSIELDNTDAQSSVVFSQETKPSNHDLFNPTQSKSEIEKEKLSNRVDGFLSRDNESRRRLGELGSDISSYLEAHKRVPNSINSELASHSQFVNPEIPPTSELAGNAKAGIEYLYSYHPNLDSGIGGKLILQSLHSDDKESLKTDVSNQNHANEVKNIGKGTNDGTTSHSDHYEADKYHPGTRKITVLKQKTMHSVSRQEEEESVNIQKKPQGRFSDGENIILKTEPTGIDLSSHPNTRSKEEIIVLVEGSQIPGKNYNPEDDTSGFYTPSYNGNSDPQNGHFESTVPVKLGETSQSLPGIKYNNHGNGISRQFFLNSHNNNLKGSQSQANRPTNHESIGSIIPTEIQFKHGNQIHTGTGAEFEAVHSVPGSENSPYGDIQFSNTKFQANNHDISHKSEAEHEEHQVILIPSVDPNELYVDAHTGQLIKFVSEEEAQPHLPGTGSDKGGQVIDNSKAWIQKNAEGSYNSDNQEVNFNNPVQHSLGKGFSKDFAIKEKHQILDNAHFPDVSKTDLSSHSPFGKPNKYHNYQEQGISNKNFQFNIPQEEVNSQLKHHPKTVVGTQVIHEDHRGGGNSYTGDHAGVDYVLCPVNQHDHDHNQKDYGQKINFGNSGHSISNGGSVSEHELSQFKGSSDDLGSYGQKTGKGIQVSNGDFHQPEHKFVSNNLNFEDPNIGHKLGSSNFKGTDHDSLDLSNSVSYKPKDDEKSFKHVYFEFPTKKGGKNFVSPPVKTNFELGSQLPPGNYKGSDFLNTGNQIHNHNFDEFNKQQNNFKGAKIDDFQMHIKELGVGKIHNHPNFMVSVQNLYGYKTTGFPSNKGFSTTMKTSGYPKGDNVFITHTQLEPQSQGNFKGTNLDSSKNSLKDFSLQSPGKYTGQHPGYEFQNTGEFNGLSLDSSGFDMGQHEIKYGDLQSHTGNLQQNSPFPFHHSQQPPVEYVLVEVDDSNHKNKVSESDSYYIQYENNFKGGQVGKYPINGADGHSYITKGRSNHAFESPNVRFVVEGGKDMSFPIRRLAKNGFQMARSLLPLMSNHRPRSINGNINFGLQISKRTGPVKIHNHFIESRSDTVNSKNS